MLLRWDNGFAAMTHDHALFVRSLRVDSGLTWRGFAEECAEAWSGDWDSNQWAGKEICERAAGILGENAHGEPWN